MQSNQSAAVSIAIYHNGEVVYADAFGNTQLNGDEPVTTSTLFQLGSTTKMFTSLATLQLVDQGVISIDDPLTVVLPGIEYLAEQSQTWQDIKLQDLMTHQGGFLDDYQTMSGTDGLTSYMLNKYGEANPKMVESGQFFNYSNPNYSFLGAVLEYLTQQDYRDLMASSVFEPLGMSRTTQIKEQVGLDGDYALGVFAQSDGSVQGYENIDQVNSWLPVIPAGIYTWSTPTELLKMADFLLSGNNDVLGESLRVELTKPQISLEYAGLPLNYGYGVFVDDGFAHQNQWYPEKVWQHGGNTAGYTSTFWVLPDQNVAVAILSTGYNDDYTDTVVEAIKSVVDLPVAQNMPFGNIDTTSFDQHVGSYNNGTDTMEITNNDGVLEIELPELDADGVNYNPVLEPIGDNTFIVTVNSEDFDITFLPRDESDNSIYIRNREFVGIRAGSEHSVSPEIESKTSELTRTNKVILD